MDTSTFRIRAACAFSDFYLYASLNVIEVVASWLNLALFTLEIALSLFYMRQWDLNRNLKIAFVLVILNDLVGTMAVCTVPFEFLVLGKFTSVEAVVVLLITTAISATVEQIYLIQRYWRVSKSSYYCAFLVLLSFTHTFVAIAATTNGEIYSVHDDIWDLRAIAGTLCTIDDILIAMAMIWTLSGIKPIWHSTQQLIRAFCIHALTTGIVVAIATIFAFVPLFLRASWAHFFDIFFAMMGRIYSLTIISNFIHRAVTISAHANSNSLQFPASLVVDGHERSRSRSGRRSESRGGRTAQSFAITLSNLRSDGGHGGQPHERLGVPQDVLYAGSSSNRSGHVSDSACVVDMNADEPEDTEKSVIPLPGNPSITGIRSKPDR
ncbi:hypothetical protein MKEN_00936700 [Mycena kentingensis (nom. inval.)]|nr:hypothetical protein MKEN_00936700 [Mycena kentingensis (nom. inval.)]